MVNNGQQEDRRTMRRVKTGSHSSLAPYVCLVSGSGSLNVPQTES